MTSSFRPRLAIASGLLTIVILACNLFLVALTTVRGDLNANIGTDIALMPVIVLLAGMGILILAKQPGHPIGIGMCLTGLFGSLTFLIDGYATYTIITDPGALPAARLAAWVEGWSWIPTALPALTLLFLLFPDGKLLTRRWRLVAIFDVAVITFFFFAVAFRPGPFEDFPQVVNPLGIGSNGGIVDIAATAGFTLLAPAIGLSAAGMIVRFRHSVGMERLQFKWLTAAAIFAGVVFFTSLALAIAGHSIFAYSIAPIFAAVPLSVGLAVLRYRLYDLDRIINRTLVYGLLSAILGGTYIALIFGLQVLLSPISGSSNAALVVTTLSIAALFLPARRRVQEAVDRRFNRRHYDAERTVAAFSARLLQQVDLETLQRELLAVVDQTMQPANVSLWLRNPEGTSLQP